LKNKKFLDKNYTETVAIYDQLDVYDCFPLSVFWFQIEVDDSCLGADTLEVFVGASIHEVQWKFHG
jgi:hypothetical protein